MSAQKSSMERTSDYCTGTETEDGSTDHGPCAKCKESKGKEKRLQNQVAQLKECVKELESKNDELEKKNEKWQKESSSWIQLVESEKKRVEFETLQQARKTFEAMRVRVKASSVNFSTAVNKAYAEAGMLLNLGIKLPTFKLCSTHFQH